jgi:purine-nucleoside phosphorylase
MSEILSPFERVGPVDDVVQKATGRFGYDAVVVLGSGLSDVAAALLPTEPVPFSAIGLPDAGVAGHSGGIYAGEIGTTSVLIFAGRVHAYEGHPLHVVTYAVRAAIGAGCKTVVLTNAAGGLDPSFEVGAPCLITDHLNLTGQSVLTGPNDDTIGPRFLDLSEVYSKRLREKALAVDPALQGGVYAGLPGPTYETPAEVRMLRSLGADLVGMSTVHEATIARYLGAEVLGVSIVSNMAAGMSESPLDHAEVAEAGKRAAARLEKLLRGLLEDL